MASSDQDTRRRLDRAIRDVRNYIFGLRPVILGNNQLDNVLQELVQEFSEASGVVTVAEIEAGAALALAKVSADVVQLVREALSNVRKHAGASTCRVSLRLEGQDAVIEVDDDGGGFDPATVREGLGLDNLRKRAQRLGGEGKIDSVPGEGTLVSIRLPVKPGVVRAGVSGSRP